MIVLVYRHMVVCYLSCCNCVRPSVVQQVCRAEMYAGRVMLGFLPPVESRWVCRQDGRTPDRYITLCAMGRARWV